MGVQTVLDKARQTWTNKERKFPINYASSLSIARTVVSWCLRRRYSNMSEHIARSDERIRRISADYSLLYARWNDVEAR